jgi:hypothetical protein
MGVLERIAEIEAEVKKNVSITCYRLYETVDTTI